MVFFNELIFLGYIVAVCIAAVVALRIGSHALVAYCSLLCVLSNVFVLKQINLFGLSATASDALAVGVTLSLNLLIEYYQPQIAQKAIVISFFCAAAYVMFSFFHLGYTPSIYDASAQHYAALLSAAPRLIAASLFTYFIVQKLDTLIYGALKIRWPERWFIVRNYVSAGISQFVDTILFSFLGLYGLVSGIGQIILISYLIKLITIITAVPLIRLLKRFMGPPGVPPT